MGRNSEEKHVEYERQRQKENAARAERVSQVWQVPDYAAEEYVELEDAFGEARAGVIASFVKAMLEPQP